MNEEIKTKWIAALRSGKYKQGRKLLRPKSDEFCCLGVLCDVIDPDGWHGVDGHRHQSFESGPSFEIKRIAQLDDANTRRLMELNDVDGFSFKKIANYIEAKL